MAKMTPRKKEEEKKKEDLTPFKFKESFGQLLLNNRFGGDSSLFGDSEQGWNALDARDEKTGLRGTAKRREAMASELEAYLKTIEDGKFNFEGTSFKDENDARTKIQTAINALRNTPEDESDDIPAFNALGLNYRSFFSNGGNEASTHLDSNGNPYTYNLWNQLQLQLAEAKAKLEAKKLKAQQANYWNGYKYYNLSKYNGRPLTSEESNVKHLNEIISKDKWSGDEASQIVQAFKLAERNGQLVSITDKNELAKFGPIWKNRVRQLRKINGIDGIYYDTVGKKFVKPYKNGQTPLTSFLDILDLNNPENKQAQIKSQLVKQMNLPIQGSLNLSDLSNFGFDEATGNELWAVINDIGAFADPEAISGTALALNAARLRDKNRDGWSWERVLDWGTSALGGLPVIGDAASVVKAGSNLVKLANRSARVGSFIGMAFSAVNMPEAWDSIKKIYDKGITSMTPQDILNITYGLMGLFAGIKTINAVNARQKPQTATEHSIEIDGKKVKLPDQATADKVSTEYKAAKNNTEASLKVVKMQEVREAAKKAGIEITDASKVTSGSGFLRGNLISRKLGVSKSPIKSELVNTGEMTGGSIGGYYMPSWRRSFLNQEQKEIKNPLRKTFDWFLGKTPEVKSTETPKTESELKQSSTPKVSKENIKTLRENEEFKQYRDLMDYKKKDSSRGVLKDGTEHTIEFGGKSYNFKYDGKTHSITINGKQIKVDPEKGMEGVRKEVSKFIQQLRKTNINSKKITKEELKEIVAKLKELKRKGFLKQGGTLNNPHIDTIIEDFIKNNNI